MPSARRIPRASAFKGPLKGDPEGNHKGTLQGFGFKDFGLRIFWFRVEAVMLWGLGWVRGLRDWGRGLGFLMGLGTQAFAPV